jgi:hypothetical protein
MAWIHAGPHGERIAEAAEVPDFRVQDDAAPEPEMNVAESENHVAEVSNVINTRLKLLEGRVQVRKPLPESVMTAEGHTALDLSRKRIPLDLGVRDLHHRLDVPAVVGRKCVLERFHVLPRHRLPGSPAASRASGLVQADPGRAKVVPGELARDRSGCFPIVVRGLEDIELNLGPGSRCTGNARRDKAAATGCRT